MNGLASRTTDMTASLDSVARLTPNLAVKRVASLRLPTRIFASPRARVLVKSANAA